MDGGAWKAAVNGVAEGRTWLSDFTFTFHFLALEKEMATCSSVLAWRIPGTGEPGGLPSMGSHRVRHDWSDLAAATTTFPTKTTLEFLMQVISHFSAYKSWEESIKSTRKKKKKKECQRGSEASYIHNKGSQWSNFSEQFLGGFDDPTQRRGCNFLKIIF